MYNLQNKKRVTFLSGLVILVAGNTLADKLVPPNFDEPRYRQNALSNYEGQKWDNLVLHGLVTAPAILMMVYPFIGKGRRSE